MKIADLFESQTPVPAMMILVHPGSCCGSTDFNLSRGEGQAWRQAIVNDLGRHAGGLLVVDSDLSAELSSYPMLKNAIDGALARARSRGLASLRVVAGDEEGDWTPVVAKTVEELSLAPETRFSLTGAWYFRDNSAGCVNAVHDVISTLGFSVDVLDSAIVDPAGDGDEDEEYADK